MWTVVARLALLCYPVVIGTIGFTIPGPQYDEALLVNGGVEMLTSSGPPRLAHDQAMWVPAFGRWWPLMALPYLGAVKGYLVVPALAVFGCQTWVVRVTSGLLALLGIWGLHRLVRHQIGACAGAAITAILAMQPALIGHTIFDNAGVAAWMGSLGLLWMALDRHLRLSTAGSAFLLGLAAGFAVWVRLNAAWFLACLCLAAALQLGRALLPPRRQLAAAAAGGLLGMLPLLVYEWVSRLGTLRFMRTIAVSEPFFERAVPRLRLFLESLFSDPEQRPIWAGHAPAAWQWLLPASVLLVAVVASFAGHRGDDPGVERWARGSALALLLYLGLMLGAGLPVRGHHLVTAIPLAAVVVVLGLGRLGRRFPAARPVSLLLFALYAVLVGQWAVAAGRSIRLTGGGGSWSSASADLTRLLEARAGDREIALLEWGFGDKLFFLSGGRLRTIEIYWNATVETTSSGEAWRERVGRGGIFVAWAGRPRPSSPAVLGFERALSASRAACSRTVVLRPDGLPFAAVWEVAPAARRASGP